MPRQRTTRSRSRRRAAPRRRGRRRGTRTVSLAGTAAGINALAQFIHPYVAGQTGSAIKQGSYEQLPMAFHADSQEALKLQNLAEAALPWVGVSLARMLLNGAGIRPPRVGKFRLW